MRQSMSADGPSIESVRRQGAAEDGSIPGAAATALALSIGIAVPAAVFGKAVLGVVLIPAAVVALLALTRSDVRRAVLRAVLSRTGLAFALFGAVSLISVLSSDLAAKSLESWARTVAFVLFGLTATQVLARDRRVLDLARRSLVYASFVAFGYVAIALFVTDDVLALIALGKELQRQVSLNFKGFASAVVCLVPVAVWALIGPGLAMKAARLCLLLLAALSIWLDGNQLSLAAVLGIISALALLGLVKTIGRLSRRFRIVAVAGLLSIGLMSAAAVTATLPEIDESESAHLSIPTWLVDVHRQFIWSFTVSATQQRPVFGYGPNTINRIEGAEREIQNQQMLETGNKGTFIPSHPHNWVYEIASETGIVGLAALCVGLLLLLRHISVLALNGSRAGWAAVAVFGAFWGSSLVNFSIWAAWWQLTFVVLMAILMAAAQPSRDAAPSRGPGRG